MQRLRDLQSYVDELEKLGDLRRITTQVGSDLEVGGIVRRCYEKTTPAPLFTAISDNPHRMRILGAPAGLGSRPELRWARVAISLGLPPTSTPQQIVNALADARGREPVPPVVVDSSPCQANVLTGDDVDLSSFPVPMLHEKDGGRYFNTWGCLIVQDPDGKWVNWTVQRLMILDGKRLVGPVAPSQHIGRIWAQWRERGEPMPFALIQGGEPAIPFACAMPLPDNVDEQAFLGAYFGEPLEVVRCVTNELCVPASAEIVVEGHVSVTERAPEGPMGEYHGYVAGRSFEWPVFDIDAITFRDEPILPIVVAGAPVDETHTCWGTGCSAETLHVLRSAKLPVTMCWTPMEAAMHWMVVTVPADWRKDFSTPFRGEPTSHDLVRRIGDEFFHSRAGVNLATLLVTYDDIDPSDTGEMLWSVATRTHPSHAMTFFPDRPIMPITPIWSQPELMTGRGMTVAYNCMFGAQVGDTLPPRVNFEYGYPAELRQRIEQRWQEYGFD